MRDDNTMTKCKVDSESPSPLLNDIVQVLMEVVHDLRTGMDQCHFFIGIELLDIGRHLYADRTSSYDDYLIRLLDLAAVIEQVLQAGILAFGRKSRRRCISSPSGNDLKARKQP